jgi:hypothetical protein
VTGLNKTIVFLFGASLALLGLGILFSGGVTVPTRSPPVRLHFSGLSLLLLGGSPLALGVMCIALARGHLGSDSRATHLVISAGTAMLGIAFFLAPKF